MRERILTQHPEAGKSGINIDRQKYEVVRAAVVESIRARGEIMFKDSTKDARQGLEGGFEGSIPWYVTTVKLDLEARGVIERISKKRPQQLRLVED